MLTTKQTEVFNILKEYIEREKIAPTVRELCKLTDTHSTGSMQAMLDRIEQKGYISRIKSSPRTIRINEEKEV